MAPDSKPKEEKSGLLARNIDGNEIVGRIQVLPLTENGAPIPSGQAIRQGLAAWPPPPDAPPTFGLDRTLEAISFTRPPEPLPPGTADAWNETWELDPHDCGGATIIRHSATDRTQSSEVWSTDTNRARLMAAAPELYRALDAFWEFYLEDTGGPGDLPIYHQVRAALKKARGDQ